MYEGIEVAAANPAEQKQIICQCDGGYSPVHRLGMWCFIIDDNKPTHGFIEDTHSLLSCNVMEYMAVINLLKSVESGARLLVRSDSKLVVNQLTLQWKINFDHLVELFNEARSIIEENKLHVAFEWVSRENNLAGKFIERNQVQWFRERRKYHAKPSESVKPAKIESFLEASVEPSKPSVKPAEVSS